MSTRQNRVDRVLEKANNIFLAGAGGGYDIFTCLPLYFALQAASKQVHLANLSFSFLPIREQQSLSPSMLKVTADTRNVTNYFPEYYLSQCFREQQPQEVPIYCFQKTGVKPLTTQKRYKNLSGLSFGFYLILIPSNS